MKTIDTLFRPWLCLLVIALTTLGRPSTVHGQEVGLPTFPPRPALPQLGNGVPSIYPAVYGKACGIVGQDPELRVALETILATDNMEALESWLMSPSPVRNVYAVEGYFRLQSEGSVLSEHQLARIAEIKTKRDLVETCSACIRAKTEVRYLVEELEF